MLRIEQWLEVYKIQSQSSKLVRQTGSSRSRPPQDGRDIEVHVRRAAGAAPVLTRFTPRT